MLSTLYMQCTCSDWL